MSKTFFPIKSYYIDASFPHPLNTKYKISYGTEMWDSIPVEVIKIQMVYEGKVSGRKAPSFPKNTNDFHLVIEKLELLKEEYNL